VLTANGRQKIERRRFVARDDKAHPDSAGTCVRPAGSKSACPLDCFLGIDHLPFKMTADAALAVALAGATEPSYKERPPG